LSTNDPGAAGAARLEVRVRGDRTPAFILAR